MKFHVTAIDEAGRPRRLTLRADSEDDAREALLDEAIFPKTIEPAPDDAKVTHVPRGRVEERLRAARREGSGDASAEDRIPPGVPALVTRCFDGREAHAAWLAARPGGVVLLALGARDAEAIVLRRENVESARLVGFPLRVLRVAMLDGRLYDVRAGVLFSSAVAKAARKVLSGK